MDSTTRGLLVALVVLLVVALGVSALMGGMMGPAFMGSGSTGQGLGPGMMPGHGWMWGFGMGLGGLAMLTFWGALIVGVVLLIRALGGALGRRWHSTPIDILKRRYAAGEITREQYDEMRKELERLRSCGDPGNPSRSTPDLRPPRPAPVLWPEKIPQGAGTSQPSAGPNRCLPLFVTPPSATVRVVQTVPESSVSFLVPSAPALEPLADSDDERDEGQDQNHAPHR